MRVGFTGTKKGLTADQWMSLKLLLTDLAENDGMSEFHHGMCVGADSEAHKLVNSLGYWVEIHGHPCNLKQYQKDLGCSTYYPIKKPLDRNNDIVAAADVMIATPKEFQEQLRSGTWATIRRATKSKTRLYVVYPDGSIYLNGEECEIDDEDIAEIELSYERDSD